MKTATHPPGEPAKNLRELIQDMGQSFDVPVANSERGSQSLHDYRKRLHPATMLLVLEALEELRNGPFAFVEDSDKYAKLIDAALDALNHHRP